MEADNDFPGFKNELKTHFEYKLCFYRGSKKEVQPFSPKVTTIMQ